MAAQFAAAWRGLDRDQRRWVLINAVLIAAVINAVLSALIAWVSALNEDEIPLWAAPLVEGPSSVVDTVGTCFVLPFLTTLIITTTVRAEMRHGRLRPLEQASPITERLPATRVRRGAVIGLVCMALLGPLTILALVLIDPGDISVSEFVVYKAIFGVVLGAVVTPPIALIALGERGSG